MFRLHSGLILRLVFCPVKRLAKGLILVSARGSRAVFWRLAKNKNNNAQQAADRQRRAPRPKRALAWLRGVGCYASQPLVCRC